MICFKKTYKNYSTNGNFTNIGIAKLLLSFPRAVVLICQTVKAASTDNFSFLCYMKEKQRAQSMPASS